MKVVINSCFGGFRLSPEATKRFAELKGKPCYFFKDGPSKEGYKPISLEEVIQGGKWLNWTAFSVPNPDEAFNNGTEWEEIHITATPDNRNDPDLIKCVEELGFRANGPFSNLRIVEIPDGIEYVIQEVDGSEWVAEKHRTWE